jgi:GT2 family glycosyltransferase
MNSEIDFSIILPVCHGGKLLRESLDSIRSIDYPRDRFEVIVAGREDVPSTGETIPMRTIRVDAANRSAALNAACAAARGTWLAFADDDCIVRPDWFKTLAAVIAREPGAGIIGGMDELETDGSAFDLALEHVLHSFLGSGGLRRGNGVRAGRYYPRLWNMALPRDVIVSMLPRVFDETLCVHEDVELAERIRRMGRRIVFAPELRIGHRRDTTFRSFVSRSFRMAVVAGRFGLHRWAHSVLAAAALGAPVLVAVSLVQPTARPVLVAGLAVYAAMILGVSVQGALGRHSLRVLVIVPALLVCCHFARGLGYLRGILDPRPKAGVP